MEQLSLQMQIETESKPTLTEKSEEMKGKISALLSGPRMKVTMLIMQMEKWMNQAAKQALIVCKVFAPWHISMC